MLPAGVLIGMARGEEGQEDFVVTAEVVDDDVRGPFDVGEDRAVVLPDSARRTAGAAGIDDAGEVIAPDRLHALLDGRYVGIARHHVAPVMHLRRVRRLTGADVLDADDVMAFGREEDR